MARVAKPWPGIHRPPSNVPSIRRWWRTRSRLCPSIVEHIERGLSVARVQPQEEGSCLFDLLVRTAVSGRFKRQGGRMIGAADEGQRLSQTPHRCTVDFWLRHLGLLKQKSILRNADVGSI